ncbi:MAG: hypothetical protein I8H80_02565 [Alphaproteobacteria bacterium]|nr:hypothetical protein [Alphaproteobacteria bacterium]
MRLLVRFMSTLLLLSSDLLAEVVTEIDTAYFQITPPVVTYVKATLTAPTKITLPPSSVPLTLEVDGIWRDINDDIFNKQISDHALEGEMVDNVPVYIWNTWGFKSKGGFSPDTDLKKFQATRLKEIIGILFQVFNNSPKAIVCLQEVNEQTAQTRTAILNSLKSLGVEAEYITNTGTQSFGQVTLYRKDQYTVKGKSVFKSNVDVQQNGRALKVYFEELVGKRQFSVVNVHLAFNSHNISGLLDELVTYAQGSSSPKSLAVIAGDFNYTVGKYQPKNPKVTVNQVGKSVIDVGGTPSIKQTANNVDGLISVQP